MRKNQSLLKTVEKVSESVKAPEEIPEPKKQFQKNLQNNGQAREEFKRLFVDGEKINSYVSIEYADNYFSARGFSLWDEKTESEKEILLINSTDFIDIAFRWKGRKENPGQALNFPRVELFNDYGEAVEGIPRAVKDSVCESAKLLAENKSLFQSSNENGNVISEKIGELAFTYDGKKKIDSSLYDSINLRLRGLFYDSNRPTIKCVKLSRA